MKIGDYVRVPVPESEGCFTVGNVVSFDDQTACVAVPCQGHAGDIFWTMLWVPREKAEILNVPVAL